MSKKVSEILLNKDHEAMLIMIDIFGDMSEVVLNFDLELTDVQYEKFNNYYNRFINGEAIQYILGYETFYGYNFKVTPDVLIPRPETEELVLRVLEEIESFFDKKELDLVDICTGSGAIACALKKEMNSLNISASDLSKEAIDIAIENAKKLDILIDYKVGNLLDPFVKENKKFDIVVSNPPYIAKNDNVEKNVIENEPHMALFGGDTGMEMYEEILKDIKKIINKKAIIAFEIGWDQRENISLLIKKYIDNAEFEILEDINGKDRVAIIRINN